MRKELKQPRQKFILVYMVIDVVCGMEIDEATTKYKSVYKGKTYYFCGPMCKLEFDERPEKYKSGLMTS